MKHPIPQGARYIPHALTQAGLETAIYRADGQYTDGRHPDSFSSCLTWKKIWPAASKVTAEQITRLEGEL